MKPGSYSKSIFIALLLSVFIPASAWLCSISAETKPTPKALFEKTCSQCHSLDTPRGMRLDRAGWQEIVARMKMNGCDMTKEEAAIIIDYLTAEYHK